MKPFYLICYLLFCIAGAATGQVNYKWFSSINASQNTNRYIYHSTLNQIFISSLDGLNIYDGLEIKSYRPSTHRMVGTIMQTTFFEDTAGIVWFTNYEGLNYYNPVTDSLDYYLMVSSAGDTLGLDYKAFYLSKNVLFLNADKKVFLFDVISRNIIAEYPIDFSLFTEFAVINRNNRIILFGANQGEYEAYTLDGTSNADCLYSGQENFSTSCLTYSGELWLGCNDGRLLQINPENGSILFQYPFAETRINSISELQGNKLLVTVSRNELVEFDPTKLRVLDRYIPQRVGTKQTVDYLLKTYVDRDSTVWVGGASEGVFFYNPGKQKFQHFLNADTDQNKINVTRILPVETNSYAIITRRNGIYLIDIMGNILQHWPDLPNGTKNFSSAMGALINDHQILFVSNDQLYLLDLNQDRIIELEQDKSETQIHFIQLEKLSNGKIIASCEGKLLLELIISGKKYSSTPYGNLGSEFTGTYYFKSDLQGNLYVSNSESSIIVLEPTPDGNHRFSYEIPILGGISSLLQVEDKSEIYLTNTYGIFLYNEGTCELKPIVDRDRLLSQTIYAALADAEGSFWLSTNSGIFKYNPADGKVKAFSRMDGVQADEFNTHAYFQTEDGGIFFGGINGLNFFYPERVTLSNKEAPVYISQVKINDELDSTLRVPQFIYQYELPYQRNTISFDFHAIDYADPSATKVKYKMIGVDEDYVESNSVRGFARYANLHPGKYIFSILGANADGMWNATPREIEIMILRPFWMTWWFYSICILAGIGIIYLTIRSYYQRKLERNNQLLREQALIIEKQKAVEHERNRIAAEMHDDLGSGLTTIRYLSDRALKQAKDADESKQIKKIADHSNKLVRNMSEIIWAMNSRFDTADNLVGYLRRYASEYLEEHQMPLKFIAEAEHLDKISMGGEKRRNVFLVFKEMLHNGVKYSAAERIEVRIEGNHQLHIEIAEIGGKGFDPELSKEKGNGLFNCCKRIDSVGGRLTFEKTDEAMHIHIRIPLNESTDE